MEVLCLNIRSHFLEPKLNEDLCQQFLRQLTRLHRLTYMMSTCCLGFIEKLALMLHGDEKVGVVCRREGVGEKKVSVCS